MRACLLLTLAGCAEVLDDTTPYVEEARVLAVRMEPPEASPGAPVQLTALYADRTGALDEAPLDWAFCLAPKPLAELGPVAPTCLEPGSDDLASIGQGLTAASTVPQDACSLFGPNPPPPREGEPSGRPADPDVTGGYYQPVVAFLDGGDPTLGAVRVRCGIANVAQETYIAWNTGYRDNERPVPTGLTLDRGGAEQAFPADGTPLAVAPGEAVTLTVAWSDCPTTGVCGDGVCSPDEDTTACAEDCAVPRGCAGAETYLLYADGALSTRREGVSATWFTTGGAFDAARTGRPGDDPAVTSSNGWTAPEQAGEVWVAVVLRDERGGVDFGSWKIAVE